MKQPALKYLLATGFLLVALLCHGQFVSNNGIQIVNNADVMVNGDWTNASGTQFLNNGSIKITESFTNSGTLDPAGTGGFELDFSTDMNFTPGGRYLGFLVKNGPGAVLVNGTISIADSLLLKQGQINFASANDTLVLEQGAIVASSLSSFVNGPVAHTGTGTLLFPVGGNGLYLPVTLHKVNASRVTASLIDAPATAIAGAGVDALIGFPYAWKISKKTDTDTAAYVEVSYPVSLPYVDDLIVTRIGNDNAHVSMGARAIANDGSRATVRSYSRGLNGVFSVAQGFPIDRVTDSLALVAFYEATGGAQWTTNTNWTTDQIDTWAGVTMSGQTITSIDLPSNNIAGEIPDQLVDILGLQTINLSGNAITVIPDFTANPDITSLDVSGNRLTFASLEPNAGVTGLQYIGQAKFGEPIDTLIAVGSAYAPTADAGGANTTYQWYRNDAAIDGATSASYNIASINRQNMGEYVAMATNSLLPALSLESETQNVLAYANISGTLFAGQDVPATAGDITLLRVTSAAYDTLAVRSVAPDGSFSLDRIVLDDYKLVGFADTIAHEGSIPTYYMNTIFWEEADTLVVEDDITNLSITSQGEPVPPSGRGVISGYLEEDDGTGGRTDETMKPKRVADVGVAARRVESTGRAQEEVLTLVAYVFTDENGEFNISNLPEGQYRLNIQYPGYPMDTSSFVTIPIGSGLESQVQVSATVVEGMINVRKLLITGVYEAASYGAQVFPNPAAEYLHLKFSAPSSERSATMLDLSGRKILTQEMPETDATIAVQHLQKGFYLLNIFDKGIVVKTMKIVIE